jgi:hypothetical protein
MSDIAGVRSEFIQTTGYELAREAVLLVFFLALFLIVRQQFVSLALTFRLNESLQGRKSTSGGNVLECQEKE